MVLFFMEGGATMSDVNKIDSDVLIHILTAAYLSYCLGCEHSDVEPINESAFCEKFKYSESLKKFEELVKGHP